MNAEELKESTMSLKQMLDSTTREAQDYKAIMEKLLLEERERALKYERDLSYVKEMYAQDQARQTTESSTLREELDKAQNQLFIEREANTRIQEQWLLQREAAEKAKKQVESMVVELRVKEEELHVKTAECKKLQVEVRQHAEQDSNDKQKVLMKTKDDELKSHQRQLKKLQQELDNKERELSNMYDCMMMYVAPLNAISPID